jgi:tetratricopeptide (TPR) repeat protein
VTIIDSADTTTAWRALGQRLAQLRKAAGYTQHSFAPLVMYGRSSVANVETGHQQPDRAFWMRCDDVLGTVGMLTRDYDRIVARLRAHRRQQATDRPGSLTTPAAGHHAHDIDQGSTSDEGGVRGRVDDDLGRCEVTTTCLDDWDHTVLAHARATRYRPARELLADLLCDIDDLRTLHRRRHTVASLRRTTILTAQMAGLVSLTLLKTNAFDASRRWGRTARTAAADAADPLTSAWVWAQEAYRSFYAGDIAEAITTAHHARTLAGAAGGVGAVLAAALEGRAHAATGDNDQTRRALGTAEDLLERLTPGDTKPSAFGYDEAQFRFHCGNAYTHLGDTPAAWTAQERALQLYPDADYLDRALIGLDRAACLLHDGDIREGAQQLTGVLSTLTPLQRDALVLTRARKILDTVPAARHGTPAVSDAHDLLAICATTTELTA